VYTNDVTFETDESKATVVFTYTHTHTHTYLVLYRVIKNDCRVLTTCHTQCTWDRSI